MLRMKGDSFIHPEVQGSVWEDPMGYSLGEKKDPGELVDFQG